MWRACMIVKYIERSLKYFKALFADIFSQKEKKDALQSTLSKTDTFWDRHQGPLSVRLREETAL